MTKSAQVNGERKRRRRGRTRRRRRDTNRGETDDRKEQEEAPPRSGDGGKERSRPVVVGVHGLPRTGGGAGDANLTAEH
jgi:hypothetical protein